jgi:hypothetical protein
MIKVMTADLNKWTQQWRVAERGLAEQKRVEMAAMTDDEARAQTQKLLSLAATIPLSEERLLTSGLVEQQRYFRNVTAQPNSKSRT